jgi:hypothetical protein
LKDRLAIDTTLDMRGDARKQRVGKAPDGESFQLGSVWTVRHAHGTSPRA